MKLRRNKLNISLLICAMTIALVGIAIALNFLDTPISFFHSLILQERVDNNLQKGSSFEQVEQWCTQNNFQRPYRQLVAPRTCTRMIAWRKSNYSENSYFGIDFYFDQDMKLLWARAFRGSGRNDDGSRANTDR